MSITNEFSFQDIDQILKQHDYLMKIINEAKYILHGAELESFMNNEVIMNVIANDKYIFHLVKKMEEEELRNK